MKNNPHSKPKALIPHWLYQVIFSRKFSLTPKVIPKPLDFSLLLQSLHKLIREFLQLLLLPLTPFENFVVREEAFAIEVVH